jgi:hypothetical protein
MILLLRERQAGWWTGGNKLAVGLSAQEILDEMPDLEMGDIKAALQYALAPTLAAWLQAAFNVQAQPLRDVGLWGPIPLPHDAPLVVSHRGNDRLSWWH